MQKQHNFRWSYTWVKTQLHTAGLEERNKRRGVHRRRRPRKPCAGMMLHQDGRRFAWLEQGPEHDLVVTMNDATSEIYSAFLVHLLSIPGECKVLGRRTILNSFLLRGQEARACPRATLRTCPEL